MKGLPHWSGKDINLGAYADEEHAALAVELFVAEYCLEYPEYLLDFRGFLRSCCPITTADLIKEFPVIATDSELEANNSKF